MAKARIKSGGPNRGRKRNRKMGMGSGKAVARIKAEGVGRPKKSR